MKKTFLLLGLALCLALPPALWAVDAVEQAEEVIKDTEKAVEAAEEMAAEIRRKEAAKKAEQNQTKTQEPNRTKEKAPAY